MFAEGHFSTLPHLLFTLVSFMATFTTRQIMSQLFSISVDTNDIDTVLLQHPTNFKTICSTQRGDLRRLKDSMQYVFMEMEQRHRRS